jgi:hypothetical protein
METGIIPSTEKMRGSNNETQEEGGLELIRKVINLDKEQRKLVNKVIDASDQCKSMIDVMLSSTNSMLDLVQKIVKANMEELNLLRKITELNHNDWELVRKFMSLCNRGRYFICKFMDWYLKDQSLDFTCSCSSLNEVDTGKGRTCNEKKYSDNVGNLRTAVSSFASQQYKGNEKFVTNGTNQEASRRELDKSCSEKLFLQAEECTGNNNIAKEVYLSERCGSSVECGNEKEAIPIQPAMTEKRLMCHEHLISYSSQSDNDFCVKPVSQVEDDDGVFHLKGTKETNDERDECSCISPVSTCSTSKMQDGTLVHKGLLLNKNSVLAVNENMEVEQKHPLEVCIQCNYYMGRTEDSSEDSLNVSAKQSESHVLTKENNDKEVNEPDIKSCVPEVNSEALEGNKVDVSACPLSTVKSPETSSQNKITDDCLFQAEGRIEIQHDGSEKESNKSLRNKGTEGGNCVSVAGESLDTILGDEVQKICSALSGKESKEIISDTNDSVSMTRKITNSLPENKCSLQAESEIETSDSIFSGHEFLLLESELKTSKRAVLDSSKEGNVSFSTGNANGKSENLITLSRDVTKHHGVHLSGKEIKCVSDTYSLLTEKECTNSVSEMSSPLQLSVNNRQTELIDSHQKAAHLCNIVDKETLNIPENMNVNNETLRKLPENKSENDVAHLCVKESENIITDTCHSFLKIKSAANLGSGEGCLGQKEVESEDEKSSDHIQEPLPPQKEFGEDKSRALDDSVMKDVLLSAKNVKVNSVKLSIISEDKTEKTDAHLTGIKNNKLSKPLDSFLATKQHINSVSEKICSFQLKTQNKNAKSNCDGQEPSALQSKLEGTERTDLDISTEKETPVPSANIKVKSKVVRKSSGEQLKNVDAYLCGKEDKKMISDTHCSLLAVRSTSKSKSEKSCMDQKETEREDTISRASREKKTSLPHKRVEMKSHNLRTTPGEELGEVGGYVFRNKRKRRLPKACGYFLRERRNTNSLSEEAFDVQPETESKCARSNSIGKEPLSSQLKLKDTKIVVLDKKTKSYKHKQIKSEGIDSSVAWENKCEEECSVLADHSAAEDASVLPWCSKDIIQPTEEVM